MKNSVPGPTSWLSLSGRELLLLAVAVAMVLGAVGVVRLCGVLWPRGEVHITGPGGTLPRPPRLNINTAEAFDLEALPRIGEKTARAIVEYRCEHGPFASLEDLDDVPNIGPETIEAIRPEAMCAPVPPDADQGKAPDG